MPLLERDAELAAPSWNSVSPSVHHLFVTVGTVQTTLVHVYRKLGVGGRRELPDALAA